MNIRTINVLKIFGFKFKDSTPNEITTISKKGIEKTHKRNYEKSHSRN